MSFAPKQFIRSVDFLSTENAINTSTGCVNIYGGMSVSKDSYLTNMIVVGNSTVANLTITGNLLTSSGNTIISSQWTSIDSNTDIYFGTSANSFVGIGTTTPGFNLDISGGSRITGGLTVGNLNVNTGASITNILNTTICTGAVIVTAGSINASFNSHTLGNIFTTGGNVGIGTSSPATSLFVNGTVLASTTSSTGSVFIGGVAGLGSWHGIKVFGDSGSHYGVNGSTMGIFVTKSGTNSLVGIGNLTPSYKLDVNGDVRITNGRLLATFDSNTIGNIFTTGGNVGIGTTSPNAPLDVNGYMSVHNGLRLIKSSNINYIQSGTNAGITSNAELRFTNINAGTTYMTITTGGNVGINTISPGSRLEVNGTLKANDITVGNINFTGNLFQNGSAYLGSQWTTTAGNTLTYTSGNVNISNTLTLSNPANATNVSSGGALTIAGGAAVGGDLIVGGSIIYSNAASVSSSFAYLTLTGTDLSTDIGNGALVAFGGISVQTTENALSATSGSGLTIGGGAGIGKDLYVGGKINTPDLITTNISSGSIRATTLITSANVASNNLTSTNILSTNISTTTLISSTVASNVVSSTTYTGANMSLSGNLNVAGTLTTVNITSTNLVNTNVSAGIVVASTSLSATGTSNTIGNTIYTTGGSVGIGIVSPAYTLDVLGSGDFSTFVTTGALYSTNQTTTHIVSTNITSGTFIGTTLSTANVHGSLGTITNMVHTNISSSTLSGTSGTIGNFVATTSLSSGTIVGTTTSTANIYGSIGTISNFVATTSLSSGTIVGTTLSAGNVHGSFISGGTMRLTTGHTQGPRLVINGYNEMLLLESTSTYNNNRTVSITFKNGGGGYWPLARLNGIDTSITTGGTFFSDFSIDVGNNTIWTERLRIKGDTGRVGIGLTSPSELLHVNGNIRGSSIIGTNNSHTLGSLIITGGNVGIGISTPSARLEVNGNFEATGTLHTLGSIIVSGGNIGIGVSTPITTLDVNGNFEATGTLHTLGSILVSGGNVGIGTTSNTPLAVNGRIFTACNSTSAGLLVGNNSSFSLANYDAQDANTANIYNVFGGDINYQSYWGHSFQIGSGGLGDSSSATQSRILNTTSFTVNKWASAGTYTNLFTIRNSGNVGIGTTNPSNKLEINNGANTTYLRLSGNTSAQQGFEIFDTAQRWVVYKPANTTDLRFWDGASDRLTLKNGGNIGIGTTSPSYPLHVSGDIYATGDVISFSDARLKTDVSTIENALEKVSGLRGVYYTNLNTQTRETGVIAQEIMDILPEVVGDKGEYLGVAYGNIVGVLIEAIKELKARVVELENQIN